MPSPLHANIIQARFLTNSMIYFIEVKQSEEWEDAHMSILSTGIDIGRKVGHEEGLEEGRKEGRLEGIHAVINVLREHNLTDSEIIQQLCKSFHLHACLVQ